MKVPYNHPDGAWNPANMRKQLRAKAEEDRRIYSPNKRDIEKILDEAFKKVFGEAKD
jgi:hypothetical protein